MARHSDKRPHELALELFAKTPTVTPTELEKFVGNGPYASKHVWFLRKLGHDISITKQGRTVVSYTYNGVGSAKPSLPKAPKVAKPASAKNPKPVKAAKPTKTKASGKPVMTKAEIKKATAAIQKMRKPKDEVEATFGSSGAIASSFSVDPDWDSAEGLDIRSLVA